MTDDLTPQSLIRYDVYLNGELVDFPVGHTRSVMYGVNGTNITEVRAVDAAENAVGGGDHSSGAVALASHGGGHL